MKKLNQNGFSMIELLVVLLIIGILSAVAAPLFINNSTKAIVSEAVAGAGSIREGERTYYSQNSGYLAVTAGNGATYFGTGTGNSSSTLGVQIHGNKYFSPDAYTVSTTGLAWPSGAPSGISTTPEDFLIKVTGSSSDGLTGVTGCTATNSSDGAANCSAVQNFIVEMDDAGTVIYSSNNGTSWSTF